MQPHGGHIHPRPSRSTIAPLTHPDPGVGELSIQSAGADLERTDQDSSRASRYQQAQATNRSRAGCRTCRTRKVKCDEGRPQCERLAKTCDWTQRWNWSDSTRSIRTKFSNVSVEGNAVWDPAASTSREPTKDSHDSLPEFTALTTDEERQRKAVSQPPGTYNVIVNLDSFAESPDHVQGSCRRTLSEQLVSHAGIDSPRRPSSAQHSSVRLDPSTVLITRFEDVFMDQLVTPSSAQSSFQSTGEQPLEDAEQTNEANKSLPDPVRYQLLRHTRHSDQELLEHFGGFIYPRIFPLRQKSDANPFLVESLAFPPLHHAICAISLISLHFKGLASWEDAIERNSLACQLLGQSVKSEQDLISDGIFYLHFLLLVYDICSPSMGENLWYRHAQQLLRIFREQQSRCSTLVMHILQIVLWLDAQACLAGGDAAGLVLGLETFRGDGILESNVNDPDPTVNEMRTFAMRGLQALEQLASIMTRQRKQAARLPHNEAHKAEVKNQLDQYYIHLLATWRWIQPHSVPPGQPLAAANLPAHIRYPYNCGFISFTSCALYIDQISHGSVNSEEAAAHCSNMLAIATYEHEYTNFEHPSIALGIFLAGVAARDEQGYAQSMHLLGALQAHAIGNNAKRAQDLLAAVHDEQQRVKARGGSVADVDWTSLARDRGLGVIDFGF